MSRQKIALAAGAAAAGFLMLFLAPGCKGNSTATDGGGDGRYPDPTFVYQVAQHTETAADTPFLWEKPRFYRTTDDLPDLDVRALVVLDSGTWAGTASGLVKLDDASDRFVQQPMTGGDGPVVDLAARAQNSRVVVGLDGRVVLHDPSGANSQGFSIPAAVRSVASDGQDVWAGTSQGLYRLSGAAFVPVASVPAREIRRLAVDASGKLWLATASGLLKLDGSTLSTFQAASGALPDDDVRAVCPLPTGGVLAGTAKGAALLGSLSDRLLQAKVGGLPYDDVTSAAAAGDLLALGHGIGATVAKVDLSHIDYYHSLRWIPDEKVNAVFLDGDKRRWIATAKGITRIELTPTTFAERAARFEAMTPSFWRLDFMDNGVWRPDPWDPNAAIQTGDTDNDGLWTQMQIVAWSYAAAATGDPAYCDKARRAMKAMMNEIDLPAVSFEAKGMKRGFVARSYVRDDEGSIYKDKAQDSNWTLVSNYRSEGHDYYWKDDTSSDETTGHFFGYSVFYDFCAKDQAERAELADHAGALARYIIDNGFKLINLQGQRTTYGYWDPDSLAIALDGIDKCIENHALDACIAAKYGAGWLNGIEILGHLLAAWHMTGDPAIYDAYDSLVTQHRYAELVDFNSDVWTVTKPAYANHSDHELAFLAYHALIRYEPNPERRQRWIQSMLAMVQYELSERNPMWSAIIAGFSPGGYTLDAALQSLREWPEDWRSWFIDNHNRKDVVLDPSSDRHGHDQFTTVLPYDEMCFLMWNGNPHNASDGGDGRELQGPYPWLLPYWILRYHGVITP